MPAEVEQFEVELHSHVAAPLPPPLPVEVETAPPEPIEMPTVLPAVSADVFASIEYAPPPPPPPPSSPPPPPPPPITSILLLLGFQFDGTVQVEPLVKYITVGEFTTLVWSMVIVFLLVQVPPVLYQAAWAGVED